MPEPTDALESLQDLLRITAGHGEEAPAGESAWLYRGQAQATRWLLPSAGRLPRWDLPQSTSKHPDLEVFRTWTQRASFYERSIPDND
jgi:hypothetical protein